MLAAICSFLGFKLSFYSGNKLDATNVKSFQHLNALTGGTLLIVTTAFVLTAILITIFLYKDRKMQMRALIGALVVSILNIYLYYSATQKFVEGNFDLTSLLSIAIPILLLLAGRNIYKDEKLVKSMDRLR